MNAEQKVSELMASAKVYNRALTQDRESMTKALTLLAQAVPDSEAAAQILSDQLEKDGYRG